TVSRSLQLKKTGVFAVLACASVLTFGCLEGGGSLTNLPDTELAEVNLQIRLGRLDTESPTSGEVPMLKRSVDQLDSVGFSDSAERLHLRNMVLRFTSNLRDTLWDTLTPGTHPVLYDPGTE